MDWINWMIIVPIIIFIGGMSLGVYTGNELNYPSNMFNVTNQSVIAQGAFKIVDGIMMMSFELASIIAKLALKNGWDLPRLFDLAVKFTYALVILAIVWFLLKLFVYVYIIVKEIKMTRSENEWMKKEDK